MLENFNAIIPLLSVLFGGIITYSVTVKTKINEISLIAKIDARDNVWIPLCTTLEDVFEYIDKNTLEPGDMISFSENIDSKKITNELFNYLKAKNRVFLCCKTRILLIHCQNLISEYENEINNAAKTLEEEFRKSYEKMIETHLHSCFGSFKEFSISISKDFRGKLKSCILTSENISCYGNLTEVFLLLNDYEPGPSVKLNKDIYDETQLHLETGCYNENISKQSPEDNLAFELATFEFHYINNIDRKTHALIQEYDFSEMYNNVFDNLMILQNEIHKNIDTITRLS